MKLTEWRKTNKITQTMLAEAVGVGSSAISLIEGGKRCPSPELARKIEDFTNSKVSAAELLGVAKPRGVQEDSTPIIDDAAHGSTVALSIPSSLHKFANDLGVDVAAAILNGGLPALESEVKRAFYARSAAAIVSSQKRIDDHGTFGQRFGVYRFR